jgi:hypothetical protein
MMKLLIRLSAIFFVVLAGCNSSGERVIYLKEYIKNELGEPTCICNFRYEGRHRDAYFEDTCGKYNVGDTIK